MGAVDLFLGATQEGEPGEETKTSYGGAHVIAKLIAGETLPFRALGIPNDCYPRQTLETQINRESINQFYLFAPRGLYQNFIVGVNSGEETLYTYLGPLLPRMGNAVYANPGAIAPLWHSLTAIGIGTKIFLGGGGRLYCLGRNATLSLTEAITESDPDRSCCYGRFNWRCQTDGSRMGQGLSFS